MSCGKQGNGCMCPFEYFLPECVYGKIYGFRGMKMGKQFQNEIFL